MIDYLTAAEQLSHNDISSPKADNYVIIRDAFAHVIYYVGKDSLTPMRKINCNSPRHLIIE